MAFEAIFYAYLVLCVAVFLEVLIDFRRNMFLKSCFLLIIFSLFVMNFFAYSPIESRMQFLFLRIVRILYVCFTMFAVIYMVKPKIPLALILFVAGSAAFAIGLRIYNFHDIDIESQMKDSNQVFSMGKEFYSPLLFGRYLILILTITAIGITYHYYRSFLMKMARWIISMVLPFFLLTIFGILGNLNILQEGMSPYLFSFFSCITIFSILLRPRFIDRRSDIIYQRSRIMRGPGLLKGDQQE